MTFYLVVQCDIMGHNMDLRKLIRCHAFVIKEVLKSAKCFSSEYSNKSDICLGMIGEQII